MALLAYEYPACLGCCWRSLHTGGLTVTIEQQLQGLTKDTYFGTSMMHLAYASLGLYSGRSAAFSFFMPRADAAPQ